MSLGSGNALYEVPSGSKLDLAPDEDEGADDEEQDAEQTYKEFMNEVDVINDAISKHPKTLGPEAGVDALQGGTKAKSTSQDEEAKPKSALTSKLQSAVQRMTRTIKIVVVKADFSSSEDPRVLTIKKKERLEYIGEQDGWYECRRIDGSGQMGFVPPAYCRAKMLEEEIKD